MNAQNKLLDSLIFRGFVISSQANLPHTEKGISLTQLNYYDSLSNKILKQKISRFERDTLLNIFLAMSLEQQNKQSIIFKLLVPPNIQVPTTEQLKKWRIDSSYGVLLDGEFINKEVLKKHHLKDFAFFKVIHFTEYEQLKLKTHLTKIVILMSHNFYISYCESRNAKHETLLIYKSHSKNQIN